MIKISTALQCVASFFILFFNSQTLLILGSLFEKLQKPSAVRRGAGVTVFKGEFKLS